MTTSAVLGSAEFDAATCNFGLSDIDALDAAMAAVGHVLRPHGSFTFSILQHRSPGRTSPGPRPATGRYYDEGHLPQTDWDPAHDADRKPVFLVARSVKLPSS